MKVLLVSIITVMLVPFYACAQQNTAPDAPPAITKPATGVITWTNTLAEGLETAREKGLPLMVDFYADWCGWCKKLDRDVYTTDQVVKLSRQFVNVKVNTDRDAATAQRYKIQGLPTVLFLGSNGEVIEQFIGYRPPQDFIRVMQEVLKNAGSK